MTDEHTLDPSGPNPQPRVPLVPASPLTPAPPPLPPADQPTAFDWGLAPTGGAATPEHQVAPSHTVPDAAGFTPPPSFPPQASLPPPVAPPVAGVAPVAAPPLADEPAAVPWTPAAPEVAPAPPADEPAIVPWTPPTSDARSDAARHPAADFGPPTAAIGLDDEAWATPSFDPALDGVASALAPEPVGIDHPEEASALDALFGESQFREYDDASPLLPSFGAAAAPVAPHPAQSTALVAQPLVAPRRESPSGPINRTQLVLMWVAGGLAAAIALVGLFVLGTRIGETATPPPAVASPEPSAPALPATGPLPPGEHAWDAIRGGECIAAFESAWQETYTVVDCATPHAAQLVMREAVPETDGTGYPGHDELAARTAELCAAPTAIDYTAAAGIPDLQVLASFAADEAEWNDGQHEYFCFVQRASGEPLTTSIAAAPAGSGR